MTIRTLDLFCSAGGAGAGYAALGHDVTGVDIADQPRYPFAFHQGDALEYLTDHGHEYDLIHASPPCQGYSGMSNCRPGLAAEYPQMVDATRALLIESGKPWVMENVVGSGLAQQDDLFGTSGLLLCGSMFGRALYRHRLFETSHPVAAPHHPVHLVPASKAGHWKPGTVISVAGHFGPMSLAQEVMGIDWMTREELAESIPPYFTEYIAAQMDAVLL